MAEIAFLNKMKTSVYHIQINVSNAKVSLPFYKKLFDYLGDNFELRKKHDIFEKMHLRIASKSSPHPPELPNSNPPMP